MLPLPLFGLGVRVQTATVTAIRRCCATVTWSLWVEVLFSRLFFFLFFSPSLFSCRITGPSGVFAGYEYAKRYGSSKKVCLFEREAELGGRFLDIRQDSFNANLRLPMGGMRWYEYGLSGTMGAYTRLANELGIERFADYWVDGGRPFSSQFTFVQARGVRSYPLNSADIQGRFLNVTDSVGVLWKRVLERYEQSPGEAARSPSLRDFVTSTVGSEAFEFLNSMNRYRSFFQYAFDVPAFLDMMKWSDQFSGALRSYPSGGMSEFPRRMALKIQEVGGRVFTSHPILSINRAGVAAGKRDHDLGTVPAGARFVLESDTHRIYTPQLAIAIPGNDMAASAGLSGDLIDDLRKSKYVQAFLGQEVVIVGMQFNRRWWLEASGFKTGQAQLDEGISSYAHIFTNATVYGYENNITRPVFLDDRVKVQIWRRLRDARGLAGVEDEVLRQLRFIYPDVVDIPRPTKTVFHYFESGWSSLSHGASDNGINLNTLAEWANHPSDVAAENCSLVLPCDAWDARKMGWVAGGWDIASQWLNRCHGTQLNDVYTDCNPYTQPPLNQTWCDCQRGTTMPLEGQNYVNLNCPDRQTEFVDQFIVPESSLA